MKEERNQAPRERRTAEEELMEEIRNDKRRIEVDEEAGPSKTREIDNYSEE